MSGGANAITVIKRKKVVAGDGHHGGAWKVAYADFVTAMMAFFLLMWLLNATTEKQRKGIADYFSPTIPLNRISGGGDGAMNGDSVFTEETLAQNGVGASQRHAARAGATPDVEGLPTVGSDSSQQDIVFEEIEEILMGAGGESLILDNPHRHIVTRVTDEGLIIELFSVDGSPLFEDGSSAPTRLMTDLARMVARVFSLATNSIAIKGHSRSHALVLADNPVWDLSLERAEAVRALLTATLPDRRIDRVSGHADRELSVKNPMAIRNDRIEIVLLRDDV